MNAQTETKAAHANVYEALAAAQSEMTPPEKNAENPAFKRDGKPLKYADLSSVVASIRAPLTRYGLSWGWRMVVLPEIGMAWEAYIHHGCSNTEVACAVPIPSGGNMQAIKSAVTYAKRIGIESVSGQAPADDDDGNAAAAAAPKEQPRQRREEPTDRAVAIAKEHLASADSIDALKQAFTNLPRVIAAMPEVIAAKDARKAALTWEPDTASAQPGGTTARTACQAEYRDGGGGGGVPLRHSLTPDSRAAEFGSTVAADLAGDEIQY